MFYSRYEKKRNIYLLVVYVRSCNPVSSSGFRVLLLSIALLFQRASNACLIVLINQEHHPHQNLSLFRKFRKLITMPPKSAALLSGALGDALSGVLAGVVSMVLFYPIDVYKTKVQASIDSDTTTTTTCTKKSAASPPSKATSTQRLSPFCSYFVLSKLRKIFNANKSVVIACIKDSKSYAGLDYKILQTITSAFTFHFISSYLKKLAVVSVTNIPATNLKPNNCSPSISASIALFQHQHPELANLFISMTSAMINTILTLPLDTIVTRKQAANSDKTEPAAEDSTPPTWNTVINLFSGLIPSLLLASNPAIHFAAYDAIKVWVLKESPIISSSKRLPSSIRDPATGARLAPRSLTKSQAFIVGFLAKTIATICTYPLIRAKVTMMSRSSPSNNTKRINDAQESPFSLSESLLTIYEIEGFAGFYKGLPLQLSHTALKSATLMMIKEEIDRMMFTVMKNIMRENY